MAKKVPKRNIEPVLVDIKKPDFNYQQSRKFFDLNLQRIAGEYRKKRGIPWRSLLKWGGGIAAAVFVIFGFFAAVSLKSAEVTLTAKGDSVSAHLFESLESIKNFDADRAQDSLVKSKEKLDEINSLINENPKNFVLSASFKFIPFLKNVGGLLKQATELNVDLINLSGILFEIQHNGFSYFRNDGDKMLELMKRGRDMVAKIKSEVGALRNKAGGLESLAYLGNLDEALEKNYFSYSNQLYAFDDFLGGLISIFESEEERHVLLMFQNSSEIRPAGGFLGSYGDLVIKEGKMEEFAVGDIYWPDHPMNFEGKYIPPEPLQRITKDWGARDANWFFDFPTSAEAVMGMLESSKIYVDNGIKFEGAIGVNVDVLGTIMEYVGEIDLPEYGMTVTAENFLAELQREVETGRDKQAGENPKKILAVLAPEIMDRLDGLPEEKMRKMVEDLSDHVDNKDVMFYGRDGQLESFFKKREVAGEVYELPNGFWGSYLAVVNANVAGGKSDAFMGQNVDIWLNVNAEGGTIGDLKVTRRHDGENEKDSWYTATNKNYIKIYTNPSSNLIFSEGSDERYAVKESYDSSYVKLDIVEDIEKTKTYNESHNVWTTEEFGKSAFATWLLTPAGDESMLEMRYENPAQENFDLRGGKKFRFVFDKQSGSDTELRVKISAPLGYSWEESGSSIYEYETDNPEKRVVIDVTLKNRGEE